ncbi:ABC transporter substrate-binding protein [Acetobacter musti]|uniref:ABC transporter substrate-binding protein n=2 Tax=Acetobacter musti TaxID=864732 RepID=A0ABX0JV99_9PROT|nr:ABC transporter substrate-binding protein [Acetobacter musti]
MTGAGAGIVAGGAAVWQWYRPKRSHSEPDGRYRSLVLAWPAPETDLVMIVARERGFFTNYSLDVTTRAVTTGNQAIAALGKDSVVGAAAPALSWLPALYGGKKAKLIAGLSAGTYRLLVRSHTGIVRLENLVGKTIAVVDEDAADRRFFSVLLRRKGISPGDVHWKAVPADQISGRIASGELDGVVAHDFLAWHLLSGSGGGLTELAGSTTGHYSERINRVFGLDENYLADDPGGGVALALAFRDAGRWIEKHRDEAVTLLAPYLPQMDEDTVSDMLAHEPKPIHLIGHWLRDQMAQYADELKLIDILPDSLDSGSFAQSVCRNVLRP